MIPKALLLLLDADRRDVLRLMVDGDEPAEYGYLETDEGHCGSWAPLGWRVL